VEVVVLRFKVVEVGDGGMSVDVVRTVDCEFVVAKMKDGDRSGD